MNRHAIQTNMSLESVFIHPIHTRSVDNTFFAKQKTENRYFYSKVMTVMRITAAYVCACACVWVYGDREWNTHMAANYRWVASQTLRFLQRAWQAEIKKKTHSELLWPCRALDLISPSDGTDYYWINLHLFLFVPVACTVVCLTVISTC